ncbi:hypothetical protein [Parapedobacter tibetensis]|uniref:hypothetical protein n=1 Tax=Parapedobacter tibetensis TaxID=2972951 RepID=UPI00214D6FF9|nr:hypothetical protein [Parapedobacter tibetensis]
MRTTLFHTTYRESATIIPSGPFTYHPDSGYRGLAVRVEVKREGVRTERRSTRDSLRHTQRTTSSVSDSTVYQQSHTLRHSDMRQPP